MEVIVEADAWKQKNPDRSQDLNTLGLSKT